MRPDPFPIDDETLMGYILMALPEDEQTRIEILSLADPVLSQRISDLRSLLSPVQQSLSDAFEPHRDLVQRTMELIDRESSQQPTSVEGLSRMGVVLENASRETKFAWIDSMVMVVAGITVLCLLLPSVWHSREESRRIACAENLRNLGVAIHEYAVGKGRGELPSIDTDGPLSFAGVYVLKLHEAKLLQSSDWVWCPSNSTDAFKLHVPTVSQFLQASLAQQSTWRRTVGGNYSYNLGNIVEGLYRTPRVSDGRYLPVAGDTLVVVRAELDGSVPVHAVNTSNVLFSDGQIRSVRRADLASHIDDPYWNRFQHRAAGFGIDDNCLAPSSTGPMLQVKLPHGN